VFTARYAMSPYVKRKFRVYSAVRNESLCKTDKFPAYSAIRSESLCKTDRFLVYSAARTESLRKTQISCLQRGTD